MPHNVTFIIETTGGAPVFHLPCPLSSFSALAEAAQTNIEFIFRNHGGTPTFHVGGAEVGLIPERAWDIGTVVRGVMDARARAAGEEVVVKLEEGMPRVALKAKGKEREREGEEHANDERGEQSSNFATARPPQPAECSHRGEAAQGAQLSSLVTVRPPQRATDPDVRDTSAHAPSDLPLVARALTCEEADAVARGSLEADFANIIQNGREDFAYVCDPAQPPTRHLTPAEEAEWPRLWDALLHLDRVFSGPLRDTQALMRRCAAMEEAAARRGAVSRFFSCRAHRSGTVGRDTSKDKPNSFRVLLAASLATLPPSQPQGQQPTSQAARSSRTSDRLSQASQSQSQSQSQSTARIPAAPRTPSPDARAVVEIVRHALQPLRQAVSQGAFSPFLTLCQLFLALCSSSAPPSYHTHSPDSLSSCLLLPSPLASLPTSVSVLLPL
ncbi:hypothetical protein B0H15DRAFT_833546 [Mycena belliarum]|uniref:Uncharacterized protein n=1 Tax=Mycena belliarum TaxID=1033014 RepID=A0AAD6U633_9AGAR|nr:hypothetical protein B0H15DRAFT_833546 [Mycena belliae]